MPEKSPTLPWRFGPVSGADMAEWSAILRDDNPIHLDRDAAETAGFGPRRVNPGPANLAYAISAVLSADPTAEFAEITAFFADNVFEDDHLDILLHGDTAEIRADGRDTPVLQVTFSPRKEE